MGNSTSCPVEVMPQDPEPFISNGELHFKAHDVGWIVAGFFGLIASVTSFWLIGRHFGTYTDPAQQRYLVRILLMVPIYAIYSWFSYFWWTKALYFQLLRDCYEAVVIASFFYLLLSYLGETEQEQTHVFKTVEFSHWIWPLGSCKYKPSGLYFLYLMKWCIGQYWIFRPGCTLAAVIMEIANVYCLTSWSPKYAHLWTSTLISISVTIAMYAVLQFYVTMKVQLAPYKPILKFLAVKSVVFLTFWQESLLSVLSMVGAIKPTKYWSAAQIQVGISAILSCFEMAVIAFLHVRCFTYKDYQEEEDLGQSNEHGAARALKTTSKIRALMNVLDFRDVAHELKTDGKQISKRLLGKDLDQPTDEDHLERAMGKTRVPMAVLDFSRAEKADIEKNLHLARHRGNDDMNFSPLLSADSRTVASEEIRYPSPLADYEEAAIIYDPRRYQRQTRQKPAGNYASLQDENVRAILRDRAEEATGVVSGGCPPSIYIRTVDGPSSRIASSPSLPSARTTSVPSRSNLRMPSPLSPSRYPGFDEASYVEQSYVTQSHAAVDLAHTGQNAINSENDDAHGGNSQHFSGNHDSLFSPDDLSPSSAPADDTVNDDACTAEQSMFVYEAY